MILKEAARILKYKYLITEIQRMCECKSKSDTSNNRHNCNHLKIIQTKRVPHNGITQNKGNAESSHDGHSIA